MPPRTPDADSRDPTIPSLASLRDPRHRTAVDLLVPAAATPADPTPRASRPPEWADLWLLGVHVARRVVTWQVGCLRRVLGR
jgi:hypothetical protein